MEKTNSPGQGGNNNANLSAPRIKIKESDQKHILPIPKQTNTNKFRNFKIYSIMVKLYNHTFLSIINYT